MADLVASDVTHTVLRSRKSEDGYSHNLVRLAFGNASDTVPSGGVPLDKAQMGCSNEIVSLKVVDQGTSGYKFEYDQSAEKLVILHFDYDATADGAAIQAATVAIAAQTLEVEVIGW